jgi:hypothetical protein
MGTFLFCIDSVGKKNLKNSGFPRMATNNHIPFGPLIDQRKLTAYGDCDNSSSKERHNDIST